MTPRETLTHIADSWVSAASAMYGLRDALFPAAPTIGINLAGIADWSSEFPFQDVFATSRPWTSQQAGKPYGGGPPLTLDANGYPTALAGPDCFAESLMLTDMDGHAPAGPYLLSADGSGIIEFNGMAGGDVPVPAVSVPVTISPQAAFLALRITRTDPTNPVRNIRLLRPSGSSPLFADRFIARTKNWPVVRFMDWTNTNNSPQVAWIDRPKVTDCSWAWGRGVPWEIAVLAANQTGSDPWFCVPHMATDDYVRQMASLLAMSLRVPGKVYFEFSNECWNTQMPQQAWCVRQGVAAGLASDPFEAGVRYYSQRAVAVFRLIASAFPDRSRLVFVLSANHGDPRTQTWALTHQNAAASGFVDALGVAPYWGHGDQLGDLPTMTVPQILAAASATIDSNVALTTACKQVADANKVRLVGYEGGQSMVAPPALWGNTAVVQKLADANRDPGIAALYAKDLANWQRISGDVLCLFSSVSKYTAQGGQPNPAGCWGQLEYDDSTDSPKMAGVRQFLAGAAGKV
jgi:hypothetical protein